MGSALSRCRPGFAFLPYFSQFVVMSPNLFVTLTAQPVTISPSPLKVYCFHSCNYTDALGTSSNSESALQTQPTERKLISSSCSKEKSAVLICSTVVRSVSRYTDSVRGREKINVINIVYLFIPEKRASSYQRGKLISLAV